MQLLIQMKLESDTIFGNGMSMPGGEDICVQLDSEGFPYLKGSTLRGIFREELTNYLDWNGKSRDEIQDMLERMLGKSGSDQMDTLSQLKFSDLTLHPDLIRLILGERITVHEKREMFTYPRTFTAIESETAKEGSLRTARCIKSGLHFYGICRCEKNDAQVVKDVLKQIKWVGTMRSRGFGKVSIQVEETER